eukprot:1158878-Pelagomonas_calceolata.AAC.5
MKVALLTRCCWQGADNCEESRVWRDAHEAPPRLRAVQAHQPQHGCCGARGAAGGCAARSTGFRIAMARGFSAATWVLRSQGCGRWVCSHGYRSLGL